MRAISVRADTKGPQLLVVQIYTGMLLAQLGIQTGRGHGSEERQTMAKETSVSAAETLRVATDIVAAYVSKNSLKADQLPGLLQEVHDAVRALAHGGVASAGSQTAAIAPSKSVTPDYIICLEDGVRLKMLKRYLRTQYGLTPEDYRRKWNLPADYPMTAPNYAKRRSSLAKQFGLGKARLGTRKSQKRGRPRKAA